MLRRKSKYWECSAKKISRTFKLAVNVEGTKPYQEWAEDVLASIENDRILVFSPKDEHALDEALDENGDELIGSQAKTAVSIREWLPVGCQFIHWGNQRDRQNQDLGRYSNNAPQVLCGIGCSPAMTEPVGPACLVGRITLYQDRLIENENAFKHVLAHELVHCFDSLMFLVPAMQDWRQFWLNVLHGGRNIESIGQFFHRIRLFLDDYGSASELARLKEFWPSHAEVWFGAFHQR